MGSPRYGEDELPYEQLDSLAYDKYIRYLRSVCESNCKHWATSLYFSFILIFCCSIKASCRFVSRMGKWCLEVLSGGGDCVSSRRRNSGRPHRRLVSPVSSTIPSTQQVIYYRKFVVHTTRLNEPVTGLGPQLRLRPEQAPMFGATPPVTAQGHLGLNHQRGIALLCCMWALVTGHNAEVFFASPEPGPCIRDRVFARKDLGVSRVCSYYTVPWLTIQQMQEMPVQEGRYWKCSPAIYQVRH